MYLWKMCKLSYDQLVAMKASCGERLTKTFNTWIWSVNAHVATVSNFFFLFKIDSRLMSYDYKQMLWKRTRRKLFWIMSIMCTFVAMAGTMRSCGKLVCGAFAINNFMESHKAFWDTGCWWKGVGRQRRVAGEFGLGLCEDMRWWGSWGWWGRRWELR